MCELATFKIALMVKNVGEEIVGLLNLKDFEVFLLIVKNY